MLPHGNSNPRPRHHIVAVPDQRSHELLNQLASNARLAEVNSREELLDSLNRRLGWAWAGMAVGWSTLVLWMIYVVRSRRRYAAAGRDRQLAVEAM